MAPSKVCVDNRADTLHREQRALFAHAAAKHKIRIAEEAKLKPDVNGQPVATGEAVSLGAPAANAPTEKRVQESVKATAVGVTEQKTTASEKAKVPVSAKAPKKTKVSKKATGQTLSGGQSMGGAFGGLKSSASDKRLQLPPDYQNALQALCDSAAAAIQRENFVTPVLLTNYNQDSAGVSNGSSVIQPTPAQAGVPNFPPDFTNNLKDLIGPWNYPPVNDTVIVLNGPGGTSNSPASNSQDSLSSPIPPPSDPLPGQIPAASELASVGANHKDFFRMQGEEKSDPTTTNTIGDSLGSTESSLDNNDSTDSLFGMDDSFTSIDSLFDEENFWSSPDCLFGNVNSSDSTDNPSGNDDSLNSTDSSSGTSLPEYLNTTQDSNVQEIFSSFPEEGGEFNIIDLISNEDVDDFGLVDEPPILSQPAGQSSNQNQPTVEAMPNVYDPQHSHVQLENSQNQSGPVGTEADGVRRISSIAREQSRMIGTNDDHFCFKCLHPGHTADTVTCPAGRVESLMDPQKETFYTRLDGADLRQKLLIQDLRWISEGLNWGIDMAQEGVLNGLGVLPSSLLYLKELLSSWKSASKSKEYTFGPLSELEVIFGGEVEIDESQQNTAGLYEITKSQNLIEVSFDSLVKGGSAPPPPRKRKNTSEKTVGELLGLEAIGARPKATCSLCFYPGHTFNSTLLCPFGRIESVVNKAKTQKTWKVVDLDDEVSKLRRVIDGLGEEDERTSKLVDMLEQWEHFSRGAGAPKSKKAYTRSRNNSKSHEGSLPLDSTSHKKRQIRPPPSRAHLHMDSSSRASSRANNGFGIPYNTGANNPDLPGDSSSPVGPGHGSSSPVSNHSSNTSVEDPLLNIPDYLGLTRRSGIKTIGARPDTICKECFYTGHDQRSQACPANILRRALFMGSPKDLENTGNSCQDIADILAWEASQPDNMKANSALRQKLETLHSKFITTWNHLNARQVGMSSQGKHPSNNRDQVFSTPQKRSYQDACFQEQNNPPMRQFNHTSHLQEQLESPIHFKQAPLPGICVDHSKLDSPTLMQILPFVINGQETREETRGLRVDHARLSPQLVMAIAPFIIADTPDQSQPIQDKSYQAGQRKESRKSFEQSSPHGGFNPYTNPPRTSSDFSGHSQFHSSPPAFQNSSGAMTQARGRNQYGNPMADFEGGQYQPGTKRLRGNY
ncbi:hypothetical protein HOY80DRAFT_1141331 [Tuber brumale]|nr:hypothetical protein HOY80DRAFT_1141331 [Tuber brumale]